MYVPKPYEAPDDGAALDLIEAYPFATIAVVTGGSIEATHVPVAFDRACGPLGTLRFHLARANPIVETLDGTAEALFVFAGPNAYVSPDWYESEGKVPTWNYIAAHVYGRPSALDGDALRVLLEDLSAAHEAPLPKSPWTLSKLSGERLAALERAIVGYTMPIDRLVGKHKLDQNKTAADRAGVVRALHGRDGEGAVGIAAMMERLD